MVRVLSTEGGRWDANGVLLRLLVVRILGVLCRMLGMSSWCWALSQSARTESLVGSISGPNGRHSWYEHLVLAPVQSAYIEALVGSLSNLNCGSSWYKH
jgi:hypothetical protein